MENEHQLAEEAFSSDQLDRKNAAIFLTNFLVGRHRVAGSVPGNESFVLNVNAEWGLGKTYFLKEWSKMLREQGHFVVYFDAWENDYAADPFVGFMSAINNQLKDSLPAKGKISQQAKAMARAGSRVIKTAAPSIAFAVIKHVAGVDFKEDVTAHFEDAMKGAGSDIVSSIKGDLEKQNKDIKIAISEFKKSFSDFSKEYEKEHPGKLPIFLMVDELDRCRPSYAIELLEKIKHVFRIENIYTIVATDSQQLAHSIKAVYGSDFDSRKYLRRFFDHESRLETPKFRQLATAILDQRKIIDDPRIENILEVVQALSLPEVLADIGQMMKITTRDFIRTIDILDTIRLTETYRIDLVFMSFLVMLYVSHGDVFDDYVRNPSSIENGLSKRVDHSICWTESIANSFVPPGSSGTAQAPVFRWLMKYAVGVWDDRPFENSDPWVGLRNAIRQLGIGVTNETKQVLLRRYHRVVTMAGHFSV